LHRIRKITVSQILRFNFFFLLFIVVLFTGCNEDFNSGGIAIDGKVTDIHSLPAFYSNKISLGHPPISSPDIEGNFHLETSSFPYNLKNETALNASYFLNGLTTVNPHFSNALISNFTNKIAVIIKFPPVPINKRGKIGFISNERFHQLENEWVINIGLDESTLLLDIPISRIEIEGYIYFLQYTESYNSISSYDNFGMKFVKLGNTCDTICFSNEEISYNPQEKGVSFFVNSGQAGYYQHNAYLNFPGFSPSSQLQICYDHYTNLNGTSIIIPDSLPLSFNIKVTSICHSGDILNEKTAYISKLAIGAITHSPFFVISTPRNFEPNINDNTEFSINFVSTDKINVFDFYVYNSLNNEHSHFFTYYTRSGSVTFRELKSAGLEYNKNDTVMWNIQQIGNFNSMDEFVEMNYYFNPKYTDYLASEKRYFIAP